MILLLPFLCINSGSAISHWLCLLFIQIQHLKCLTNYFITLLIFSEKNDIIMHCISDLNYHQIKGNKVNQSKVASVIIYISKQEEEYLKTKKTTSPACTPTTEIRLLEGISTV